MILADSNLIIYAGSGKYPVLIDWFAHEKPAVSAISLVEVLGYPKLQPAEKVILTALFAKMTVFYPTPEIFEIAIDLRQQRKMTLGDSLVAATALFHHLTLATHNNKDFMWISTLALSDPLVGL